MFPDFVEREINYDGKNSITLREVSTENKTITFSIIRNGVIVVGNNLKEMIERLKLLENAK